MLSIIRQCNGSYAETMLVLLVADANYINADSNSVYLLTFDLMLILLISMYVFRYMSLYSLRYVMLVVEWL